MASAESIWTSITTGRTRAMPARAPVPSPATKEVSISPMEVCASIARMSGAANRAKVGMRGASSRRRVRPSCPAVRQAARRCQARPCRRKPRCGRGPPPSTIRNPSLKPRSPLGNVRGRAFKLPDRAGRSVPHVDAEPFAAQEGVAVETVLERVVLDEDFELAGARLKLPLSVVVGPMGPRAVASFEATDRVSRSSSARRPKVERVPWSPGFGTAVMTAPSPWIWPTPPSLMLPTNRVPFDADATLPEKRLSSRRIAPGLSDAVAGRSRGGEDN